MYESIIEDGTLENYITQAKKYVTKHDRSKYIEYLKIIEDYSSQKKLLISASNGMKLLCGEPVDVDGYSYECYGVDPYRLAVEIANRMYDELSTITGSVEIIDENENVEQVRTRNVTEVLTSEVDINTLQVRTEIRNKIVVIDLNGRGILKINNIGVLDARERTVESIIESQYRMMELVSPVPRTGFFSSNTVYCLPEMNQLISVYRVLCNPARHSDWRQYLNYESKLYALCIDELEKSIVNVIEGNAESDMELQTIIDTIYQRMNPKNKIIIGDYAEGISDRLQFITSEDMVVLRGHIKTIIEKYIGDYDVIFKKVPLYVPEDIQLEKYTFYLVDSNKNCALFDVYNSTKYDIIPYRKQGFYKIGNQLTILRYRFVDLWAFKIIAKKSPKLSRLLIERTRKTIPLIKKTHNEVVELLKTNPVKLFSKYNGEYIPDRIAIRHMKTDKKKKVYSVYNPSLERKN